jgi:Domain of unknown function (DUF4157)
MYVQRFRNGHDHHDDLESGLRPGKRTLTSSLSTRAAGAPTAQAPSDHAAPAQAKPATDDVFALHLGEPAASSGAALPAALQAKMSTAFGADLSTVRVHHDSAAESIGAHAFASGNDLHFAPGHYDPDSSAGQALIGHELAHVVQQRDGRVAGDGLVVDHGLEHEADTDGERAARGESIGRSSSGSASSSAVQGQLKQAFLPAVPAGIASAWGALTAWSAVEANVTAAGILTSLAGGTAGVIGPAITPGASGVQQYTIAPWKSADAEGRLTMYVQVKLINAAMAQYAKLNPPKANAAPGAAPALGGPDVGCPEPMPAPAPKPPAKAPPVVGAPVPTAPTGPTLDPSILESIKIAARAEVDADLAKRIQDMIITADSSEYVWSDSGSKTPDGLGTVGSIKLNRMRSFRLTENLKLDAGAMAVPEIAATGLNGKKIDVMGIFGGDLITGPHWRIGLGDSLGINVHSRDELPNGIALNTDWAWDGNTTYMTLEVSVTPQGGPTTRELGQREGTPDDNYWQPPCLTP